MPADTISPNSRHGERAHWRRRRPALSPARPARGGIKITRRNPWARVEARKKKTLRTYSVPACWVRAYAGDPFSDPRSRRSHVAVRMSGSGPRRAVVSCPDRYIRLGKSRPELLVLATNRGGPLARVEPPQALHEAATGYDMGGGGGDTRGREPGAFPPPSVQLVVESSRPRQRALLPTGDLCPDEQYDVLDRRRPAGVSLGWIGEQV